MKISKETIIKYSLFILLIGMPFGYKLGGRFAVSNIAQILSTALILPYVLKERNARFVFGYSFSLILMVLSSLYANAHYHSNIRIPYILFFILVFIYFSYMVLLMRRDKRYSTLIKGCFRTVLYFYAVLFGSMAVRDILILRKGYSAYTFDDKSHTVIMFSFLAFIALRVLEGKRKWLVSLLFLLLSLTTISRLVVIFLIFYAIYLYLEILHSFRGVKGRIFGMCVAVFVLTIGVCYLLKNQNLFSVFGRLSSDNAAARNSTDAHINLIIYAVKLKFENIWNFLFGVGPGGFANALAHSSVDFSEMRFIDRGVYEAILLGTTPVHSSHFQIMLEFSIFYFLWYCRFLLEILILAIKRKNVPLICFFIPLICAVTLYSTSNELLYYCLLLYCFAASREEKNQLFDADDYKEDREDVLAVTVFE